MEVLCGYWGSRLVKMKQGNMEVGSDRLCMENIKAGKQKGKESTKVNAEAGDCDYEWPG